MVDLTQRQRTMLELESNWWKYADVKEAAVREHLGRLRRMREQRLRARRAS